MHTMSTENATVIAIINLSHNSKEERTGDYRQLKCTARGKRFARGILFSDNRRRISISSCFAFSEMGIGARGEVLLLEYGNHDCVSYLSELRAICSAFIHSVLFKKAYRRSRTWRFQSNGSYYSHNTVAVKRFSLDLKNLSMCIRVGMFVASASRIR